MLNKEKQNQMILAMVSGNGANLYSSLKCQNQPSCIPVKGEYSVPAFSERFLNTEVYCKLCRAFLVKLLNGSGAFHNSAIQYFTSKALFLEFLGCFIRMELT